MKKKKVFYSDEVAIKAYVLRTTTNKTLKEIGKTLNICPKSVRLWAEKIAIDPDLKAKAEKKIEAQSSGTTKKVPLKRTPVKFTDFDLSGKPAKKKKPKIKNGVEEIIRLNDEINYLKWYNMGLKQGFVSKLMEEE